MGESDGRFSKWTTPVIEEKVLHPKYHFLIQNKDGLQLGYRTDIGEFTYINAKRGVIIEDYVQIGSHCSIYSISTIDGKEGKVELKRNCRIGSHSVVMPGITIGANSIVGAFSLVNRSIPPNVVAMGIPVKVFRDLSKEELENMEQELGCQ